MVTTLLYAAASRAGPHVTRVPHICLCLSIGSTCCVYLSYMFISVSTFCFTSNKHNREGLPIGQFWGTHSVNSRQVTPGNRFVTVNGAAVVAWESNFPNTPQSISSCFTVFSLIVFF